MVQKVGPLLVTQAATAGHLVQVPAPPLVIPAPVLATHMQVLAQMAVGIQGVKHRMGDGSPHTHTV